MDRNLLEYVKNVVELEKAVFAQTQVIEQLDEEIEDLGYPQVIPRPNPPEEESGLGDFFDCIWTFFGLGALVGIFFSFSGGDFWGNIFGFGFASVIIFAIIYICSAASSNKKARNAYETQLAHYRALQEDDQKRVNKEKLEREHLKKM